MVTAETAMALPTLFLMAAFVVTLASATLAQERCLDAARETVRAAARGEPDADQLGHQVAPAGAGITVATHGDTITAEVTAQVKPFGLRLPGVKLHVSASGVREDTS